MTSKTLERMDSDHMSMDRYEPGKCESNMYMPPRREPGKISSLIPKLLNIYDVYSNIKAYFMGQYC